MKRTKYQTMMQDLKAQFNARFADEHIKLNVLNGENIFAVNSVDFSFSLDDWTLYINAEVAGDGAGMVLGSDYERHTEQLPNGKTVSFYCFPLRHIAEVKFRRRDDYTGIEPVVKFIIKWFRDHENFYLE